MKLAKNFAAALLLVFAFSLTSFAGDQQTPGAYTPPPPHLIATQKGETSEVPSPNSVDGTPVKVEQTSDTLWYEALLSLLSVY